MSRSRRKEPLYRKVNTRTHGVRHGAAGGDYRHERNSKAVKTSEATRGSMHKSHRHGLDYTPLYRFLLSKVGQDWAEVHSEAVARLDREDPIWRMVARTEAEKRDLVCLGESSWFSGLFVDGDGRLARVNPDLRIEDMEPDCPCCTHTFNGKPFVRKYRSPES